MHCIHINLAKKDGTDPLQCTAGPSFKFQHTWTHGQWGSPKTSCCWREKKYLHISFEISNLAPWTRKVSDDVTNKGVKECAYILKATQSADSAFSVSKILRKKCVNRDDKILQQKCVNNRNHKNLVSMLHFC